MRLQNSEAVASGLEAGLGDLYWLFEHQAPQMRLRMMGACGVASLAVAEHTAGSTLIISRPNLSIDPDMTHVFMLTEDGTIIDPNYSTALQYAGLTPGYIQYGGKNTYPDEKIAVFPRDNTSEFVDFLVRHARIALDCYVKPRDKYYNSRREFAGMSDDEIARQLSAIWDEANFYQWTPDDKMKESGKKLASFILPEHVKIVTQ